RVVRYPAKALLLVLLLLPAAAVGVVVHYPAYRAVGFVATGLARGAEDGLASVKVLAAMLLFPLTWTGAAMAMWLWRGIDAALLTVGLLPLTAYAGLVLVERVDRVLGAARALWLFRFKRLAFLRMLARRMALQEEIL